MSSTGPHLSIDHWLDKLDLTIYRSLLKDYNGVEDILWMSERDLKNIGIKNGSHRARLSTSLKILKDKYDRTSREFSPSERYNLSTDKANRSFNSISPINQMTFEKPHSGVRSWPCSGPSSSQSTKHSSPRSSMESFVGTEATADELKKALEKELSLDSSDLRSYAWYHGTILRQRAEELVVQNGDFIVRDCISQPGDFVITCKWQNVPLHFIIKKVILQPDTLYERIQYCFENDSFDSIPDFVTYYVGSKCPLSASSGAIISRPINRTMPLSYYASRYGIQCQMHYAAKALEKIPTSPLSCDNNFVSQSVHAADIENPKSIPNIEKESSDSTSENKTKNTNLNPWPALTRVGSDPMLSPNTERRRFEHRPNSGTFSSDIVKAISLKVEDKPPPKPSRVPSRKCVQRPMVLKRRQQSVDETDESSQSPIPIPSVSLSHAYLRQTSETRFSFLDRPSISDDGSVPDMEITENSFTIPILHPPSIFEPQTFRTPLLTSENTPLEGTVLSRIREALLSNASKISAFHLTRVDLEIARNFQELDLGLGVTNGLELLLLPQGEQLQKDLLERTESMKIFVAVTILTTPGIEDRVKILNKWIEIAIETKTTLGNFYGFASVMLGLTIPEVTGLQSTWLALRHSYTESAFAFETKMKPAFKSLQNASDLGAPNICFPYILSLILILQQHSSIMSIIENQPFDYTDNINNIILNFSIPGSYGSDDFGLQLLADHLALGRNIIQQIPGFIKNGQLSLRSVKYDDILLDMFSTEFHLRMLWGYRGSVVHSEERHQKFQKVLQLLHNKCNEV
ncbi:breast cancer anti-estrogen resistance protein 3 homolog [Stegodyphus dumicola]|uniref:breast cancer anti-estrogen resistance protein 3 homolog n=1 Tax=Stegodyphus dumicola TaxID=202533 RepID=UPI0015A79488|nr:breast cancer anti-estrogen resistance protein 3 homolog [Stegodyphus dumicola]XP_035226873.1 breast cancer anti-estrogen resistance protein 3 homolog [Stegodyphus dumicola]